MFLKAIRHPNTEFWPIDYLKNLTSDDLSGFIYFIFSFILNYKKFNFKQFFRQCWLESSFVGIKPLESPQTPVIDNTFSHRNHQNFGTSSGMEGARMNGNGESTII